MSDSTVAVQSAAGTGALDAFFEGLSKSLREGHWPAGAPNPLESVADPSLRQRLTLFVSHIGRLPGSVHERLAVALNRDQIPSKLWLLEHLFRTMSLGDSRIFVVGAWYGILPLLLECLYPSWRIEKNLIDLDPAACEVAAILLEGIVPDVAISCRNAKELDYGEVRNGKPSIVINTICEHMSDFPDWFKLIQPGQRIALQSNDHRGCCEHTNCVASLEEFESQAPLSQVCFRGTLPLANFRRFMLVGVR